MQFFGVFVMCRVGAVLFSLLLLGGCATPYQQSGFRGGYSETQLDNNVFKVSFNGNSSTSGERVSDFVLLRCAELALNHGYKYFVIVDSKNYSSYGTYTTPIIANTNGSGYSYGRHAYGSSITTITGGQTYSYVKPGLVNMIICYKEKLGNGFSYDAKFIQRKVSEKYSLS